ncbi:hypothetical protein GCM10010412_092190 [Nonomuraea recticatena]|uniref:ApeA N-terminal domain-containing protein n=2 Tax=Nonomuraea recticatena TaxID=46178 RepID=A0ABN3TB25_9ACTN
MPDTADEARNALKGPKRAWSSPSTLTVPSAAMELKEWLGDSRSFDPGNHPAALQSAIDDFNRSTESALPMNVRDAIQAELTALKAALVPLRNDATASRAPAEAALGVLLERLKSPDVLRAAWLDLWAKCGRVESSPDAIALRRDLFLACARLAEHDLEEFLYDLDGLLDNDASTVLRIRVALGDTGMPDSLDAPEVWETTELSATGRRDLVSRYLALPVAPHDHVVWLAYERAALHLRNAVTIENMAFFESQIVPPEPQAIDSKLAQYGEQWTDHDGHMAAEMARGQGIVLVRVFLPANTYVDPVQTARDQVEALVTLGKFHADASWDRVWHLLPGAQHKSPTQLRLQLITPSSDPAGAGRDRQARVFREMATWATAHSKIPITEGRLAEAIELLGWWRDAQDQSALGRVTANVRVIEVAGSRVGTTPWGDHLSRYMKSAWLVYQCRRELAATIYDAVGAELSQLPPAMWQPLQTIKDKTVHYDGLDRVDLVPNSTRTAVEELQALYPRHHQVGRRLRTLHNRLDKPAAFDQWLTELKNQWLSLVDRLVRIRNAITHGGPATPGAVDSIALFSSYLAAWEVEIVLEAALTGDDLVAAHNTFQTQKSDFLEACKTAQRPGDHLYI